MIEKHFEHVKRFKEFLWPFAVAIFAVGGMGGAFIGPYIAKAIGRYFSIRSFHTEGFLKCKKTLNDLKK